MTTNLTPDDVLRLFAGKPFAIYTGAAWADGSEARVDARDLARQLLDARTVLRMLLSDSATEQWHVFATGSCVERMSERLLDGARACLPEHQNREDAQ